MKRALTGAILVHAASILLAAGTLKNPGDRGEAAYFFAAILGLLGFIALIAAAIKKDTDPKD